MAAPRYIQSSSAMACRFACRQTAAPVVRRNHLSARPLQHSLSVVNRRSLSTPADKPQSSVWWWLGGGAAGAAGMLYYFQYRNSTTLGTYKNLNSSEAASAIVHKYPGVTRTLSALLGKDVGESISKALEALEHAQKTAATSDAGKKLRQRAQEVDEGIKDLLKEGMKQKESAVKELGPSAMKHYEAVKSSFTQSHEGVWGNLENALQAMKKEGNAFVNEAKHSEVGDKLRQKLDVLLKKAEDIRIQAEKLIQEQKK